MTKIKSNRQTNNVVKQKDSRDQHLSTKSDMVIAYTKLPFSMFVNTVDRDSAVIAEDSRGMYITRKSYVDAPVLDPYRQYRRTGNTVVAVDGGYDIEFNNDTFVHVDIFE